MGWNLNIKLQNRVVQSFSPPCLLPVCLSLSLVILELTVLWTKRSPTGTLKHQGREVRSSLVEWVLLWSSHHHHWFSSWRNIILGKLERASRPPACHRSGGTPQLLWGSPRRACQELATGFLTSSPGECHHCFFGGILIQIGIFWSSHQSFCRQPGK